ncbi:MAG TPA: T9SS type A sorting domain-containing protein [Ferruginibacter sp.]|nr:T9SS type A sorting domain-containing protein [Ferruginibacter sp.]HRO97017.1 T9SS type A sorting domain-containing protein [Ferruginibacter sp.]
MTKYFLLLMCLCGLVSQAQPPNNNIFLGGRGDGAAYAINIAVSNTIFGGGVGDGFAKSSYMPAPGEIYRGGVGDGFTKNSYLPAPNDIYRGGEGDGFAKNFNVAPPNNIFKGGLGDGWSAVIFPMGPLPVELLSFYASHEGKSHKIQWATATEINTKHFEVQRSANARNFETVGITNATGNAATGATYSFMVHHPWEGNNFYRLKIVDVDGSVTYSNIVLLKNDAAEQWAVYPNPTAQMLNVKIPLMAGQGSTKAVISDMHGKMVIQTTVYSGNVNAIDVSKLPAGIYILHCTMNAQQFVLRFIKQ